MRRLFSTALALAALGFSQSGAQAQNLLVNGSFEDPGGTVNGTPGLAPGSGAIPGWLVTDAEIAWVENGAFNVFASDGARCLDLSGYHDSAPYGGIAQLVPTQPNAVYRLTVDLGSNGAGNNVSLLAFVGAASTNFTFVHSADAAQEWGTFSFDFTATSASTTVSFTGLSSVAGNNLGLDNASLTYLSGGASAPEPGSLALLLLTGAIAMVRRRRAS